MQDIIRGLSVQDGGPMDRHPEIKIPKHKAAREQNVNSLPYILLLRG